MSEIQPIDIEAAAREYKTALEALNAVKAEATPDWMWSDQISEKDRTIFLAKYDEAEIRLTRAHDVLLASVLKDEPISADALKREGWLSHDAFHVSDGTQKGICCELELPNGASIWWTNWAGVQVMGGPVMTLHTMRDARDAARIFGYTAQAAEPKEIAPHG